MTSSPVALVLRALGLGDLLTAVPAVRGLRAGLPSHRLALATSAWLAPFADHLGIVDELLPARALEPVALTEEPEIAVNLHGRGPQSTRLLADLHPGRLVAFAHPDVPATDGLPAWRAGEHEVERWCRLVGAAGFPADPADLDIDPPPVSGLTASAWGATVIHPGASTPARQWPVERWAAVARAERADRRAVVITGSHAERPIASAVAAHAGLPPDAVLAGRTDVLELAAVIGAAARVVTGDTGVGHLATALRTPSVVLFGPVPPSEWGPPPGRDRHRALWAGRRGDPHAETIDAGLLEIGVDDVVAALETV